MNPDQAKERVARLSREFARGGSTPDSEAIDMVLVMLDDAETDSRRLDFLEELLDGGAATLKTKIAGIYERDERDDDDRETFRDFIDTGLGFILEDCNEREEDKREALRDFIDNSIDLPVEDYDRTASEEGGDK